MNEDLDNQILEIMPPFELEKLTKEEILQDNIINYLISLPNSTEKIRIIERVRDKAKSLGVIRAFNNIYKQQNQDYIQNLKRQGGNEIQFTDCPIQNLKCGQWNADDQGIYKIDYTSNMQPIKVKACPHPVLPIEIITNIDTAIEKVKLASYKNKQWQYIITERKIIASNTAIIQLANRGIEVNSDNAKHLVTFLAEVIELNVNMIPNTQGITHLGWTKGKFVPYTANYKYDGDNSFKSLFDSIESIGDYEKWKEQIKKLRKDNKILHFLIASSFASPLIEILNINPFIIHLWGKSGTGKTVALMIAMSVWGNPAVGKLTKTLNSTNVGFERTSSFLRNIPFAGDELQSVKNQYKDFNELIYRLTQGEGKNQGTIDGGVKEQQYWRCLFLTTGEEPITSEYSKEGVKNRCIEIEENNIIVENGNEIVNFVLENHGQAGKEYIENLPEIEEIKRMYSEKYNQLYEKYNTTAKQINAIATVLVADEIISKNIFQDQKLEIEDVNEYFSKDIDEADRIYSLLLNWFYQNINKFKENEIGEIWGKYEEQKGEIIYFYVNPKVLKDFLRENGVSFDGIKRKLADKGYLERQNNGEYTQNARISGRQGRCIKVLIDTEREDIQSEESYSMKQQELPF